MAKTTVTASPADENPVPATTGTASSTASVTIHPKTPASLKPPRLDRVGKTIRWNHDAGIVVVETSHERHSWTPEAEIGADSHEYSPIDSKGTEFYRVRAAGGLSNDVVIHFNSPA